MARTRSLAQLRTEVLQRADMENTTFVDTSEDGEVTRYINLAISDLYDYLIQHQGQEFYLTSFDIATVAGTQEYSLQETGGGEVDDFYLLWGVECVDDEDDPIIMQPYMPLQRHTVDWIHGGHFHRSGWAGDAMYRIFGTISESGSYDAKIRFSKDPGAVHTIRIWYIPHAPVLDENTDSWDGFNGWEEYVVLQAAISCLTKEESDTDALEFQLAKIKERIKAIAPNRDVGFPEVVQDTHRLW